MAISGSKKSLFSSSSQTIDEGIKGAPFIYPNLKEIAEGSEGKVYLSRDSEGQEVVLKKFKHSDENSSREAYAREIAVLEREGTLIASNFPHSVLLPFFRGKTLRECLYQLDENGTPIGKKSSSIQEDDLLDEDTELTIEQKNSIAYSLIRDFHIINQLGIIHADLKSDNIVVDKYTQTAKIIDMG